MFHLWQFLRWVLGNCIIQYTPIIHYSYVYHYHPPQAYNTAKYHNYSLKNSVSRSILQRLKDRIGLSLICGHLCRLLSVVSYYFPTKRYNNYSVEQSFKLSIINWTLVANYISSLLIWTHLLDFLLSHERSKVKVHYVQVAAYVYSSATMLCSVGASSHSYVFPGGRNNHANADHEIRFDVIDLLNQNNLTFLEASFCLWFALSWSRPSCIFDVFGVQLFIMDLDRSYGYIGINGKHLVLFHLKTTEIHTVVPQVVSVSLKADLEQIRLRLYWGKEKYERNIQATEQLSVGTIGLDILE